MPLTRIKQTALADDGVTTQKLDDTAGGLTLPGVQYVQIPVGTTAQRDATPANGQLRYNTDFSRLEQYAGGAWQAIDSPPAITTLTYTGSATATTPAGGETITLTGTNFQAGATVTIDGTAANGVAVPTSTSITFTAPAKTAGDYDVVVTNSNGLSARLTNGISYNGTPSFTTAAGNVGSVVEDETMTTITIVAAEPDGGTLAYSITGGALPTGVSLGSANGQLTGTPNVGVTSDTTYTFTVTATDDESQTNSRQFTLIVLRPVYARQISNSLRFNGSSSIMYRVFGTPTDRQTWTVSCWVKRSQLTTGTSSHTIIDSSDGGTSYGDMIRIRENKLNFYTDSGATGSSNNYFSDRELKDVAGWYHIVVTFSKTSGEVKGYVNGNLEGTLAWNTGTNGKINTNNYRHHVGRRRDPANWFDGYMADFHFVDGQVLPPTNFAEDHNGVWVPKTYSGTFGNNGFHLLWDTDITSDNSSNSNDFTVGSNLDADDRVPDSPTTNFATLDYNANQRGNISNGALSWSAGVAESSMQTIGMTSGKWYFEWRVASNNNYFYLVTSKEQRGGSANTKTILGVGGTGSINSSNATTVSDTLSTTTGGDIMACRLDVDNKVAEIYQNNTKVAEINQFTLDGPYYGAWDRNSSSNTGVTHTVNFGQDSTFNNAETATTNADENGIGEFAYPVPAGYLAVCAKNLPETTISPSTNNRADNLFKAVVYNGDHTYPKTITTGFQPDFVYVKNRTGYHGRIFSCLTGTGPHYPNNEYQQDHYNDGPEVEMLSTGFRIINNPDGTNSAGQGVNVNNQSHASWSWKAGGAPSATNSATSGAMTANSVSLNGTLQSAYTPSGSPTIYPEKMSINTEAGFSMITYEGNGTDNATVPHGLSSAPEMSWIHQYANNGGSNTNWDVSTVVPSSQTGTSFNLDTNGAWFSPTNGGHTRGANVLTLENGSSSGIRINRNTGKYIAFCWHSVPGFSKIGTYVGNNSADGTVIDLGFKPAFFLLKSYANGGSNYDWVLFDNAMDTANPITVHQRVNEGGADVTGRSHVIFLSNGVKHIQSYGDANSGSYVYMAFAENPFKYAPAR